MGGIMSSRTIFSLTRTKGGPAPLYVNPYQAQAGFVAVAKSFVVVLALVGVVVNKLSDETCQENILGFFVAVGGICLICAGLFLHLSMISIAADTEWRGYLFACIFATVLESVIAGWGVVLWMKSSSLVSVKQCMQMTTLSVCTEFKKIRDPDDCPGRKNFSAGDADIDCEVDFLCRYQASSTFIMGAVVSVFTALTSHFTAWVVFIKFLPSIAVQGRELTSNRLNFRSCVSNSTKTELIVTVPR
jgi:hypothetical protein